MAVARPLILGIDPGKVTGMLHLAWPEIWSEVPRGNVSQRLIEYLECPGIVRIACEQYVMRPGRRAKTAQPDALEVMGVVRDFAAQHDIPVDWCQPGAAKNMISNRRLKKAGCLVVTPDMHASDAARQALRCCAIHWPEIFAELVGV